MKTLLRKLSALLFKKSQKKRPRTEVEEELESVRTQLEIIRAEFEALRRPNPDLRKYYGRDLLSRGDVATNKFGRLEELRQREQSLIKELETY